MPWSKYNYLLRTLPLMVARLWNLAVSIATTTTHFKRANSVFTFILKILLVQKQFSRNQVK